MDAVLAVPKSERDEHLSQLNRSELQALAKVAGIKANQKNNKLINELLKTLEKSSNEPQDDAKEQKSSSKALKIRKRKSDAEPDDEGPELSQPSGENVYCDFKPSPEAVLSKTPVNPLFANKTRASSGRSTKRKTCNSNWTAAREAELSNLAENLKRLSTVKKSNGKSRLSSQPNEDTKKVQPKTTARPSNAGKPLAGKGAAATTKTNNVNNNKTAIAVKKPHVGPNRPTGAVNTKKPPLARPSSSNALNKKPFTAGAVSTKTAGVQNKGPNNNNNNKKPLPRKPIVATGIIRKKPSVTPKRPVAGGITKSLNKNSTKPIKVGGGVAGSATSGKKMAKSASASNLNGGGVKKTKGSVVYPNARAAEAAAKYAARMKAAQDKKAMIK